MILVPHEELGEAFMNLWFIDDKCPHCKKMWTKDDDMKAVQVTRVNEWLQAWHDTCLHEAHPELFESEQA